MQAESQITVACIQMEPKIGEKKANVAHSLDKIAEAAGKGAALMMAGTSTMICSLTGSFFRVFESRLLNTDRPTQTSSHCGGVATLSPHPQGTAGFSQLR